MALTPGWMRSEMMLETYGVTEERWRDALERQPHFGISETPLYTGRAVAALAADPDRARWNGSSLSSGRLAQVYGYTDVDGSRPDAWRYMVEVMDAGPAGRRDRLPLSRGADDLQRGDLGAPVGEAALRGSQETSARRGTRTPRRSPWSEKTPRHGVGTEPSSTDRGRSGAYASRTSPPAPRRSRTAARPPAQPAATSASSGPRSGPPDLGVRRAGRGARRARRGSA